MSAAPAITDPTTWGPGQPATSWAPQEWSGPDPRLSYEQAEKELAFIELVMRGADIELDAWQKWVILEVRARWKDTGELRNRTALVCVPRQSGKTQILAGLGVLAMFNPFGSNKTGPRTVLGVAGSLIQADITASRMRHLISVSPSLLDRVMRSTETRGIRLHNGSRAIIMASSAKALNGMTAHDVLFDEVHLVDRAVYDQLVLGASAIGDAQIIGITTQGDQNSDLLHSLIERGREDRGVTLLYWHTRPDLQRGDPDFADQMRAANPAVACGRLPLERLLADCEVLDDISLRRFRMNLEVDSALEQANRWITEDEWAAVPSINPGEEPHGMAITWSLDTSIDRSVIALAVAWRRDNGDICAALVEQFTNDRLDYVAERLRDYMTRFGAAQIAVDNGRLHDLADHLSDDFGTRMVTRVGPRIHYSTPQSVRASITAGRLFIDHNRLLDEQVNGLIMKYRQDGSGYRVLPRDDRFIGTGAIATITAAGLVADDPRNPNNVAQIF